MSQSGTIRRIISELKSVSEGLTPEERDQLKSELLTMALFGEPGTIPGAGSLTEKERELIRKLADKTNQLWKLNDQPGEDQ